MWRTKNLNLLGQQTDIRPVYAHENHPLPPHPAFFIKRTVENLEEATWYYLKGAKLVGVKVRPVQENKRAKAGMAYRWIFLMEDIPIGAVQIWNNDTATFPIRRYMNARKRLKLKVRQYLA